MSWAGLSILALGAGAVTMFSIRMALPAHLLERLPTAELRQQGVSIGSAVLGNDAPNAGFSLPRLTIRWAVR